MRVFQLEPCKESNHCHVWKEVEPFADEEVVEVTFSLSGYPPLQNWEISGRCKVPIHVLFWPWCAVIVQKVVTNGHVPSNLPLRWLFTSNLPTYKMALYKRVFRWKIQGSNFPTKLLTNFSGEGEKIGDLILS